MRRMILLPIGLLLCGPAVAQQPTPCDLLKMAVAGNAAINSKPPKAAPPNMAWPAGSTIVGDGRYMVALFDGTPSSGDTKKMEQAAAAADRQVAQCLPGAKRSVTTHMADREILFCVPGTRRSVTIATSSGSRMISAHLTVETPRGKVWS